MINNLIDTFIGKDGCLNSFIQLITIVMIAECVAIAVYITDTILGWIYKLYMFFQNTKRKFKK